MKKISTLIITCFSIITVMCSFTGGTEPKAAVYKVSRLKKQDLEINADWNKPQWRKVKEIAINNFTGDVPAFRPVAKAKMMYDDKNLYVIFKVEDQHVRIQATEFNGPVSADACVEFFFSPDTSAPMHYFNLEVNAGGTPLMGYHLDHQKVKKMLQPEELKLIEIAHSLPKKLEKEIAEPVTWTVEYRVPLDLLRKYSPVTQPKKGVSWHANFYKTASRSSNPHWITWSVVNSPKPDFHLPEFFGTVTFK
jgi:hypothetical protein